MDQGTAASLLLQGPAGYALAGVFGAVIGSFLNVCIHRIPLGISVVRPPSHCPRCGVGIRAVDNVPVLSYLLLGGRCRACRAPISGRYPLVEVLTAFLSVALFHGSGVGLAAGGQVAGALAEYLTSFAFAAAMLVIAFIDLDHLIIPNCISYPGIGVGLLLALLPGGVSPLEAAAGFLLGAGSLLVLIHGYSLLRGVRGMGYGDVKLLGMVGAFLGYRPLLFVVFAAALQGVVAAAVLAVARILGARNLPLYDPRVLAEEGETEPAPIPAGASHGGDGDRGEGGEGDGEPGRGTGGERRGHDVAPADQVDREDAFPTEGEVPAEEPGALPFLRLAIPFGPFLALGAIEYLLVGERVTGAYIGLMEDLAARILGL